MLERGATSAEYKCADVSGIASCSGTVSPGQPLDTSTAGEHTVSIFAQDVAGNTASTAVRYLVHGRPEVSTLPVPTPGRSAVTLEGTVDPQGANVEPCQFEYRLVGAKSWTRRACGQAPGNGIGPMPVSAALTGLTPNTPTNSSSRPKQLRGETSSPREFTTAPPAPPTVVTGEASQVKRVLATLNGTVNPNEGSLASCVFEYGNTVSYGKEAPCVGNVGSGNSPVAVTATSRSLLALAITSESWPATWAWRLQGKVKTQRCHARRSAADRRNATGERNRLPRSNTQRKHQSQRSAGRRMRVRIRTSLAFPTSVPCTPTPEAAQATPVAVKADLHSLSANTTYEYRVVARNAAGRGLGSVQTFSTLERPEVEAGRCVKPTVAHEGHYSDAGCTVPSVGGAYEWQPLEHARFRFQNGAAVFETHKVAMRCSDNTLSGEYAGPHVAGVSLAFGGCEATSGLSGKCQEAKLRRRAKSRLRPLPPNSF